ncbi:MAG: hypothetical protein EON56_05280 [Alphaproteobacteria bacterium]|nr:MAG: hypothetical protein EON56_05280 [Alphaproteobacteria bacterium]
MFTVSWLSSAGLFRYKRLPRKQSYVAGSLVPVLGSSPELPNPKQNKVVRLDKKSNGLELNIDALADICLNEKCRERPLCVVSIAGDFRKGKSFMLNFFLRYLYHVSDKQQTLSEQQRKDRRSQNLMHYQASP